MVKLKKDDVAPLGVTLTARISPAAKAALDKAAREDNRTISSLVAKIIADWLKAQGGKK